MKLHIIQTSAVQDNALFCCIRYAQQGDSIALLGDAINALLQSKWQQALAEYQVFLLSDDIKARGLNQQLAQYTQLSQIEFVEQTLQHSKVITW